MAFRDSERGYGIAGHPPRAARALALRSFGPFCRPGALSALGASRRLRSPPIRSGRGTVAGPLASVQDGAVFHPSHSARMLASVCAVSVVKCLRPNPADKLGLV